MAGSQITFIDYFGKIQVTIFWIQTTFYFQQCHFTEQLLYILYENLINFFAKHKYKPKKSLPKWIALKKIKVIMFQVVILCL